ncbi:Uncharacterized protein M6B38_218910 [Iris pallida]|uniref:RRM domain-containing protein n=1 Tax=Iris pallida TaxID=29817 RepID=A0AAX6DXE7_IRIPA|nr:Uncharacterized protein M6B38_218910 [Iris pallida]
MTTPRKRYFSSVAASSSSPNPFDASREYMDHSDVREFGFKRQQLLGSSSSYFGPSPSSSFMYSGSYAYAGQLPQFPVVRLRGLPFDCADSDILEFFNGLQILDILFVNKGGRFSGEAFCVMAHALQVDLAIQRNRQNMGRRYIEVFRSNKQEYYSAVAHEVSDTRGNSPRRSAPVARSNDDGKDLVEHTGVLRMRGLPYSAGKDDIMDFFKDYQLSEETVHIVLNSNGRPAGEAYVEFANAEDSKSAMGMDRMTLGSRYIELFPSTAKEMNQAISKANEAAFHDTEAEKINAHVGWRQPDDNDGLPTEESQKENTQLQFLLGHQQKGDSILAVGELRRSQPSCGIQVDPHLTDNAHLADDSLKKVMEDQTVKCQAYRQRGVASSKCDLLEHSILANHASQVMVGPSDYKQENFYREGLNSVHVPDMGAPQEYDSDQLDHLTLQERRNLILSSMNDAQHYCLDLKFSQDEGQPCTYDSSHTEDLKFSQDEGQPCTYDSIHTEDSEVIPERQRHGAPMSNLESIAKESSYRLQNVSSSSLLDKTKNANAFPADQTKSETQPANEGLLHDECYVHHAGHDARKSKASVFIGSPKSVILGEEFGSVNAKLESRSSAFPATLVAVKAEPVGEIPVTCISESSDATPYSSNMSAPALPSSIAPSVLEENVCLDDPSSSRYKFHQKHKNGIRSSDEWGISDARQSFLDQRHVNENAHNPHSSLIISVFPLEVKAEPVEGSSINVIPEENIEELASSIVSADFREEHISGNCNASYQASDPKDSLCSSNGSQFSTTRFCSLGTVIPESSCLINCCAATGSIPEVDFGASNKLPDSVSPNCLERPKLECVENGLLDPCQTPPSTLPEHDVQRTVVKSECFDEVTTDVIDHIPLYLRMHTYKSISEPTLCNNIESSLPTPLSSLGNDLFNSDNVKEKRFSLRRKKKKTATDSVETALEEDAPGLLQFLLDRGITAEEIKLYGERKMMNLYKIQVRILSKNSRP